VNIEDLKLVTPEEALRYIRRYNNVIEEKKADADANDEDTVAKDDNLNDIEDDLNDNSVNVTKIKVVPTASSGNVNPMRKGKANPNIKKTGLK
jgi:hypothetical protein